MNALTIVRSKKKKGIPTRKKRGALFPGENLKKKDPLLSSMLRAKTFLFLPAARKGGKDILFLEEEFQRLPQLGGKKKRKKRE